MALTCRAPAAALPMRMGAARGRRAGRPVLNQYRDLLCFVYKSTRFVGAHNVPCACPLLALPWGAPAAALPMRPVAARGGRVACAVLNPNRDSG